MSIIRKLLDPIPLPPMARIRQKFDSTRIDDIPGHIRCELEKPGTVDRLKPGQQVAVAVGSRGIQNLAVIVRTTIDRIKETGAAPFIVPCMGSHGGATAEGQVEILKQLGITEAAMGSPIRASMDVAVIDTLDNGLPVYVDRYALEADAIVVINRIKPHTAFRGPYESGVMKMIAIGLGKQKGAEAIHQLGFKHMAANMPAAARVMIRKLPIVFGIAIVENAYDQTCRIEALPIERVEERELELLVEAKERIPKLLFEQIDVLVIDWIGKNISGDGMDPNVTGRFPTPYAYGGPDVTKIVALDLTPESKGNAAGIGLSDFTTRRLVEKMNAEATYANGLTSTVCLPCNISATMENDFYAIKAAVKTCNIFDYNTCRLVRIRDTLHLGEILISASMLEEARRHPDIEVLTEPGEWMFDNGGYVPKA
ncbi:lactate racemase domain-containing protein [Paenibacillus sp. GYB004]|uniref:lactate racemase domain-containing protein n=1 Tax=Paenibacillus sp. GYB004 TaxID=2994393 RepID=UPI002F96E305